MYIWWFNTKLQSLGEHSAKTACPGKLFLICNEFWHAKGRPFWMIHLVYCHFLQLSTDQRENATCVIMKLKTRHTFWHTAGYMDLKTVTGRLSITRFPKLEHIAVQIVLYMSWPKKIQKSLAQSWKWIMSGCHFENFYMRTFLINNSFSEFFSFSEVLWRVPFFRKKILMYILLDQFLFSYCKYFMLTLARV